MNSKRPNLLLPILFGSILGGMNAPMPTYARPGHNRWKGSSPKFGKSNMELLIDEAQRKYLASKKVSV